MERGVHSHRDRSVRAVGRLIARRPGVVWPVPFLCDDRFDAGLALPQCQKVASRLLGPAAGTRPQGLSG